MFFWASSSVSSVTTHKYLDERFEKHIIANMVNLKKNIFSIFVGSLKCQLFVTVRAKAVLSETFVRGFG